MARFRVLTAAPAATRLIRAGAYWWLASLEVGFLDYQETSPVAVPLLPPAQGKGARRYPW